MCVNIQNSYLYLYIYTCYVFFEKYICIRPHMRSSPFPPVAGSALVYIFIPMSSSLHASMYCPHMRSSPKSESSKDREIKLLDVTVTEISFGGITKSRNLLFLEIMGPCSERISNEQCPQQSVSLAKPGLQSGDFHIQLH